MVRQSISQHTRLIRRLLPACDNDTNLANRHLTWMKQKIISERFNKYDTSPSLSTIELTKLDTFIQQRVEERKPLQYILGSQPFYDLDIITRPPTLIPRWETEEWVERLVKSIGPYWNSDSKRVILDVCTGTGCVALGLASHLPNNSTTIVGMDISTEAISLANDNLRAHEHLLRENKVEFREQDIYRWKEDLTFDLVVSNPPYVTQDEYTNLDAEVKQWEDKRALVADDRGTQLHQRLIELTASNKRRRQQQQQKVQSYPSVLPTIVMEIGGSHQVQILRKSLSQHGFEHIHVWKDLAGKDRVILAS